jgi:hypothetical protein
MDALLRKVVASVWAIEARRARRQRAFRQSMKSSTALSGDSVMNVSLRKILSALWTREALSARRRYAPRQTLQCELLEGRQLLSKGAMGWMGGPAFDHLRGGVAAFGQMAMSGADGGLKFAPDKNFTGHTPTPPSAQLVADFQKLQTDTHAILAKSQVTVAETTALRDDFKALNKAATSAPSQTALQTFQTDLKSIQGALPTDAQKAQLVTDFTALENSRGVTDSTLINKTVTDTEAIVASSNITSADLATIAADQAAIQTDLGSSATTKGFPGAPKVGLTNLGELLAGGAGGFGGFGGHVGFEGPGFGGRRG